MSDTDRPEPAPDAEGAAPASSPPTAAQRPAPPVPPYAAPHVAAEQPVSPYAAEQPVSPYAASPGYAPPYARPATYAGYPGTPHSAPSQGAPHQSAPGAPPTWGPAPVAPVAPGTPGSTMGVIAMALAIVAVLSAFIPFAGAFLSWMLLIPAVVLGIIALVRRAQGRGFAIAALALSAAAAIVTILWGIGMAMFGSWLNGDLGDDTSFDGPPPIEEEYGYPALGIDPSVGGATRGDALAFGTGVTLVDENIDQDVWTMTLGTPQDVTENAADGFGVPPTNGAYLAVPVELTNLSDETIDLNIQYEYVPRTWLLTGDGGTAESMYLTANADLPSAWDIAQVEPGQTVVYYDIYDVTPQVASTGFGVADLDSGAQIFWGPAG